MRKTDERMIVMVKSCAIRSGTGMTVNCGKSKGLFITLIHLYTNNVSGS